MQRSYLVAATAALALLMQTPFALAQSAPAAGAPAATNTAPERITMPNAATETPGQPTDSKKGAPRQQPASQQPARKQPARKMTRQQELDYSMDNGTVPARYRSRVPKEYQQYVPFEKQ
ncbi:hypothetical protein [Bradyrhizobium sp. 76]|jgi:hypothetical protein|uniref:hypothetical protein n=1 Tax=Bradyrhizobium sp. 76 TaxID=2782680 RepID=UPI001FF8900E|nr:hypothetical protein [Bradyrhizobium sp. 76]MCK1408318.1 hypothetical protein [Bradyrhizobium sp. 76]